MNFRILSLALLICLAGHASTALAEDLGTFVPTGTMIMARWGHTATLLTDGRVLIAGGAQGNGVVLSAAEIYDPVTGTFPATGDLNVARFGHSATLLVDGTVLIAGGIGGNNARDILADAELYDPSIGLFAPVSRMVTAQFNHAATLLPDGRVLFAGGQVASAAAVVSAGAEIYDPTTGSFASTGAYAAPSALWSSTAGPIWPTANLLPGGTVLIAGNNPAERYDLLTGEFRVAGTMTTAEYRYGMYSHSSTLLLNGKVLIAGGTDDNF